MHWRAYAAGIVQRDTAAVVDGLHRAVCAAAGVEVVFEIQRAEAVGAQSELERILIRDGGQLLCSVGDGRSCELLLCGVICHDITFLVGFREVCLISSGGSSQTL